MHIAELLFKDRARTASRYDAEEAVVLVISALERNGQLNDRDLTITRVPDGYRAIVGLPEPDSLRPSLNSKHVRVALRRLHERGMSGPHRRLLGREFESAPTCACRKPSAMVLETSFVSREVPLRCGDCGRRVPLYRFRHTTDHGTYEDILRWAEAYRCLDSLWMGSGVGERSAYRQLSRHDSELSREGLEIRRRIEQRSKVPTYHYLLRHYARSINAERKRRCPSCGRNWLLDAPWLGFHDFRCDRCRLVSNIGFDVR